MTLQELYDKIMANEELKNSFVEAAQDKGKLEAWLKEQGCDATAEQIAELLSEKQNSGEMSDDELENVAGGYENFRVSRFIPGRTIPIVPWLCPGGIPDDEIIG